MRSASCANASLTQMKRDGQSGFLADEGMVRIDCAKIDKVTAEGDYMRIHSAGQSWMVHSTMGALSDCLDDSLFVCTDRSWSEETSSRRMTHDQSHWTAQLNDGTRERVAKVHVSALLESLRANPSKHKATSSTIESRGRTSRRALTNI